MNTLMRDIPPDYGGTVTEPNVNDVLSGRGGRINSHPGNVYFRELVNHYKYQYLAKETAKLDKAKIADMIVRRVRSLDPPGRFLKEVPNSTHYIEIGDEKARKKAGQAMREKSQTTRKINEEQQRFQPSAPTSMYRPGAAAPFPYPNSPMYMNQAQLQGYPGAEQSYPSYSNPPSLASTAPSSYASSTTNPFPYASPQSPYPDASISQQFSQQFPTPHLTYQQTSPTTSPPNKTEHSSIPAVHGAAFNRQFEPLRSSESSSATTNSLKTIPMRSSESSGITTNSSKTLASSSSNSSSDMKLSALSTEAIPMESVAERDEYKDDTCGGGDGDDECSLNRSKYLPHQLNVEGDACNRPTCNKIITLSSVAGTYALKRTQSDPEQNTSTGASMRLSFMDSGKDDSIRDFLNNGGFGQDNVSQEITGLSTAAVIAPTMPPKTTSTSSSDRPIRFKMERATSGISDFSMGSAASRSGHSSGTSSWLNNIHYDASDKLLNGNGSSR
jgi:hypothetical protein